MKKRLPELRSDLSITQQTQRGETVFVVKEPLDGQYYKFGVLEFSIIKKLNGNNNLKQIQDSINVEYPDYELDLNDIKTFVGSLNRMNLLEKTLAETNSMLISKLQEERKSKLLSKKGSILYKRFPLFNPNRFFSIIHPYISFFWKKPFVIFCLLMMVTSGTILIYNWREVLEGVLSVYSFHEKNLNSIIILWCTVFSIIALHECAHGLTCKNFGGNVPEIGFLLLFFQPCLYANVNDAWSFTNKKHKFYTVFAGGYFEFLLGSVFTYIWIFTNKGTAINAVAYQAMMVCGLSSVLFNFNPLMKFDGYYALSDYLEIPNLKNASFDYLKACVRHYIWRIGDMSEFDDYDYKTKRALLIYGICSFFYMASILVGVFIIAKMMVLDSMRELGLLIILLVMYKMGGSHIKNSIIFLRTFFLIKNVKLTNGRGAATLIIILGVILGLLFIVPYNNDVITNGSLISSNEILLRSPVSGQLVTVNYIKTGRVIPKGAVLLELENLDKKLELKQKKIELDSFSYLYKKYLSIGDSLEADKINSNIIQLHEKIKRLKKDINNLTIKNPLDSILITEDLHFEIGKHYTKGDELVKLLPINSEKIQAKIEIAADQVRFFKQDAPVQFKLNIYPKKIFVGKIIKILPKSSSDNISDKTIILSEFSTPNFTEPLMQGMTGLIRIKQPKVIGLKLIYEWAIKNLKLDIMFF